MTQVNLNSKNHYKILGFAIVASVVLHVVGIASLNNVTVSFYSPKRAYMEHYMDAPQASLDDKIKKEENRKRVEDLVNVFKDIKQKPLEEEILRYDAKNIKTDYVPQDIATTMNPDINAETLTDPDIDLDATVNLQTDFENVPTQDLIHPLPQMTINELLKPNNEKLAEELIQATEMLKGVVATDVADVNSSLDSIPTGTSQMLAIEGNSLKDHNGLLDQGFADTSSEAEPLTLSSTEINALRQDVLSHISKKSNVALNDVDNKSSPSAKKGAFLPLGKDKAGRNPNVGNIASRDDFILKVAFAPKSDQSGYLFKLELVPKDGVVFKRINQNYFFLIDRSHSIRPLRYDLTKQAVAEALDYLQEGDTFNILVFDEKIIRFAPENIPVTQQNIELGKQFVMTQKYAGAFTSTDLYSSLDNIVPSQVKENEVNTAILLSDGDTFLSKDKQRESICLWTDRNNGKVTLFSVPAGGGNNLALLELLSTFNRGFLFHAAKDRNIGETLSTLMYAIQNPIGKDIMATAIPKTGSKGHITLFPTRKRLPNLYEHIPYTIYGYVNNLDDFHLFLQGRYYDKWLDIKEHVSFEKAQQSSETELERMWAVQQAYNQYEYYLKDGQREHLRLIKKLLFPYKLPLAFQ